MVRAVRTRSGVEFYAEGWPEGIGPTAGVAKRNPTGRKPGRPKRPFRKALEMIVLRTRMKIYEAQGCSRESAVLAAMADFDWPKRAEEGEVKRVLLEMRRVDKAELAKLQPIVLWALILVKIYKTLGCSCQSAVSRRWPLSIRQSRTGRLKPNPPSP